MAHIVDPKKCKHCIFKGIGFGGKTTCQTSAECNNKTKEGR